MGEPRRRLLTASTLESRLLRNRDLQGSDAVPLSRWRADQTLHAASRIHLSRVLNSQRLDQRNVVAGGFRDHEFRASCRAAEVMLWQETEASARELKALPSSSQRD